MVQTTFSYKNYFRPTPENLQYWTEGLHGIIVTIATTSYVQGASQQTLFIIFIVGYVLDKISKFFARVSHDSTKTVEVSFPADMADKVDVTQKITGNEDNQ